MQMLAALLTNLVALFTYTNSTSKKIKCFPECAANAVQRCFLFHRKSAIVHSLNLEESILVSLQVTPISKNASTRAAQRVKSEESLGIKLFCDTHPFQKSRQQFYLK